MNEYLGQLLQRHYQHGIIVDTNILLLYFVGSVNRPHISKHKRTRQYLPEDFDILSNLFRMFSYRIVSTPNILTEVSNLLGNCDSPNQKHLWQIFVKSINIVEEKYTASKNLTHLPVFPKFGLTDSSIIELVRERYLVLTDDAMLYQYLEKNSVDVLNFTHLRTANLIS